jgi:hypothetical protein
MFDSVHDFFGTCSKVALADLTAITHLIKVALRTTRCYGSHHIPFLRLSNDNWRP